MANKIRYDKKMCIGCKKDRPMREFYVSNSRMFPDGKVNLCKTCIKNDLDETSIQSIKRILRELDRPFIESIWKSCLESEKDTLGWYLRQVSTLPQYKDMTYDDSKEVSEDAFEEQHLKKSEFSDKHINYAVKEAGFQVSNEVKLKWGQGYTDYEYMKLENHYKEMCISNDISTPQSKKNLEFLCKMTVKMEKCLEQGEYGDFEKLSRQYDKMMQSSGIRPIDKNSSAESQGIRSFGQIFEEIERDGYIEPKPVTENPDIVDKTIFYMSNYQRKLMNLESLIEIPDDTPREGDDL